jgi:site-specific DNA-methyltransferase (adenine-specific)
MADSRILVGDCLERLADLPDNSIDSIVTDPPYDLTANKKGGTGVASLNENSPAGRSRISTGGGFMGKEWDSTGVAFRVDVWLECLCVLKRGGHLLAFGGTRTYHRMACAIEDEGFEIRDSIHWTYGTGFPKSLNLPNGLGTALKPSHEPIVVARKPLEGTVANNVLKWGTGALNIDGCRVGDADTRSRASMSALGQNSGWNSHNNREVIAGSASGRWPANSIFDEAAGEELGVEARFFYCAKASTSERNAGLDELEAHRDSDRVRDDGVGGDNPRNRSNAPKQNPHPTVKPIALMRYLCRLVTPPNGTVLDPFLGSGTTAVAAILEGFEWVGCEITDDYIPIIEARVAWANEQRDERLF